MLPDGWSFKNINEIGIQVIDGDRGKNYPKDNEFQSTGSCLFLSAKNVTKAGFDFSLGQFITNEKHKLLNKGEVEVGDIVITTRGSIGHFAYYKHKKYQSMRINSGMAILRSKVNYTYPDFLYEVCRSQIVKTQIEKASFGSAQPQLTIAIIKKFRIPVPPLPEQKKIAAILSTWDRAIEETEKLLANSQQQKKALMQQLLTGKKRLPGFTGEWKLSPISAFIKESRVPGNSGDIAKKITIKLYGKGVVPKEEKREGSESTKYYKRKSGQFIYSKLDFLNGAFGIIPSSLDGYESTLDLPAFDFLHNVSSQWFIFYVSREEFYSANLGLANGGRKARRVNPSDLLRISVPTPPLPEQKAIAAVLSTADKEIAAIESDLSRLRQEKKALMQQLLTGKRRVKVD